MADVRLGDAVTTGGPSRRILVVLVIELLVLVGSLTTTIVLSAKDPSSSVVPTANGGSSNTGTPGSPADQAAAVATAKQFTLNVQDYPPFNESGYQTNVVPMLTTKAKAQAASQLQALQAVLGEARKLCASAQGQSAAICKAYEAKPQVSIAFAALASYDGNSATVLVPHLVTYVSGGASQKWEFQVSLDKVGGKWLIDTYCTVNATTIGTATAAACAG